MARTYQHLIKRANRYLHIPKSRGVYMITDCTGKSYIGSSLDVNKRVLSHTIPGKTSHVPFVDRANMDVVLLENCKYLTTEQLLVVEYENIIKYNTIWPNGYNKVSPLTNLPFGIESKKQKSARKITERRELKSLNTKPVVIKPIKKSKPKRKLKPAKQSYKTKPFINILSNHR